MGRVKRSTVPTEVDANFDPVGDDLTRGFLWTENEYDWKGRTTRTINTDGTDKLYSYDGCGCAGGQVTTIKGEEIIETDWQGNNPNNLGRRTQKVYADILGRAYKAEVLNWDGTVYSSSQTTFNGRDQATEVKRYAGTTSSTTFQTTTMTYDGHGRLKTQHRPEQDANTNTSYIYNDDDSIQKMTDARGASTNYTYNNRSLVTQVNWTVPTGSNIEVSSPVSFTYDSIGNRTLMTDALGNVEYKFDELSRLTEETRQFNETVPAAPTNDNKFRLKYTYDIAGQLKTLEEPFGEIVTYNYNKVGQLETVSGNRANLGTQHNYVNDVTYRAWGAIKQMNYSTTNYYSYDYNNRLLPQNYKKDGQLYFNYTYYGDGSLKTKGGSSVSNYDQSYQYDFVGRQTVAKTGIEARGGVVNTPKTERPYRHEYIYDAFDNLTKTTKYHWQAKYVTTESFTNGRVNGNSLIEQFNLPCYSNACVTTNKTSTKINAYDADGRPTSRFGSYLYDAQGGLTKQTFGNYYDNGIYEIDYTQDGDGIMLKKIKYGINSEIPQNGYSAGDYTPYCEPELDGLNTDNNTVECEKRYYSVYSSVLQKEILEISETSVDYDGVMQTKGRFNIYALGEVVSVRTTKCGENEPNCSFTNRISITGTRANDPSGSYVKSENDPTGMHIDPFGGVIGTNEMYERPEQEECEEPYTPNDGDEYPFLACGEDPYPENEATGNGSIPQNKCYVNGFETNCNFIANNSEYFNITGRKQKQDKPKQKPFLVKITENQKKERKLLKHIHNAIAATGAYDEVDKDYIDDVDFRESVTYLGDEKYVDPRVPGDLRDMLAAVDKDRQCKIVFEKFLRILSNSGTDDKKFKKKVISTSFARIYDSIKLVQVDRKFSKKKNRFVDNGKCDAVRGACVSRHNGGQILFDIDHNRAYYLGKSISELFHAANARGGTFTDEDLDDAAKELIGNEKAYKMLKSDAKSTYGSSWRAEGMVGHKILNFACNRAVSRALGRED